MLLWSSRFLAMLLDDARPGWSNFRLNNVWPFGASHSKNLFLISLSRWRWPGCHKSRNEDAPFKVLSIYSLWFHLLGLGLWRVFYEKLKYLPVKSLDSKLWSEFLFITGGLETDSITL